MRVERLIRWLVPAERAGWAEAMCAELGEIRNPAERTRFALGCLLAALCFFEDGQKEQEKIRMPQENSGGLGLAANLGCAVAAALIGLVYLRIVSAPATMLAIHGGAVGIGLMLFWGVRATRPDPRIWPALAAFALLATALLGSTVAGASRWVTVGGLFIQTSSLLLPIAVVAFARRGTLVTMAPVLIIAIALALQPDRAMAGALLAGTMAVLLCKRSGLAVLSTLAASASFLATLLQSDRLPAVSFVDHILWTSFSLHPLMGAAMWAGCALLLLPTGWALWRSGGRDAAAASFTAIWLAIIAAAALGAYPTPFVGYGASAIIGYFLGLAALFPTPLRVAKPDAAGTGKAADAHASDHQAMTSPSGAAVPV